MTTKIHSAVIYEGSGQENSGWIYVRTVRVKRLKDDDVSVTLQGSGYLRETRLRMPPDLARAVAHAILTVEEPPASEIAFNLEEVEQEKGKDDEKS